MKILGLLLRKPGVGIEAVADLFEGEEHLAWQKYVEGRVRELYWAGDGSGAVAVLEYDSVAAAEADLAALPMARGGFLEMRFLELQPFAPLEQLFRPEHRSVAPGTGIV